MCTYNSLFFEHNVCLTMVSYFWTYDRGNLRTLVHLKLHPTFAPYNPYNCLNILGMQNYIINGLGML